MLKSLFVFFSLEKSSFYSFWKSVHNFLFLVFQSLHLYNSPKATDRISAVFFPNFFNMLGCNFSSARDLNPCRVSRHSSFLHLGFNSLLPMFSFPHISPWQSSKNKKAAGNVCIFHVISYHFVNYLNSRLFLSYLHLVLNILKKKSFLLFYLFFKSFSLLYLITTEVLPIFYLNSFSMRAHREHKSRIIHLLS